ncbi:fumarylacetoacetate hydrolase family protein [Arthrobacter sp. M4]|uniref:fumarylacetoacetate hydrolase family protein n=1 Tax=Arthrobacter sp. M4 TaxID=218160 RepID=UPI0035AC1E55
MRLANISNRLMFVTRGSELIDISQASSGRFSPRIQECYEHWDELREFIQTLQGVRGKPLSEAPHEEFGNPAPQPRQIFAIGLNYADHAAEAGLAVPEDLTVFTKFATALAGPYGTVALPPGTVDWEVELVAIIGSGGQHIPVERRGATWLGCPWGRTSRSAQCSLQVRPRNTAWQSRSPDSGQ